LLRCKHAGIKVDKEQQAHQVFFSHCGKDSK
jgi:hypothetical protein